MYRATQERRSRCARIPFNLVHARRHGAAVCWQARLNTGPLLARWHAVCPLVPHGPGSHPAGDDLDWASAAARRRRPGEATRARPSSGAPTRVAYTRHFSAGNVLRAPAQPLPAANSLQNTPCHPPGRQDRPLGQLGAGCKEPRVAPLCNVNGPEKCDASAPRPAHEPLLLLAHPRCLAPAPARGRRCAAARKLPAAQVQPRCLPPD